MKQSRFSSLEKVNAEHAEELYHKAAQDARIKFLRYARLSGEAEKFLTEEK
jgi:pyruvate-ferredoxin/flavodoxin oxidoreductase